jgi:beta-galactosidase
MLARYASTLLISIALVASSVDAPAQQQEVPRSAPASEANGGKSANPNTTDVSGVWRFSLDRNDEGVKQEWFKRELTDYIKLPGILQSQGYGDEIGVDTPWVAALPRDMRWYLRPEYKAYTTPGHVKIPYLSQPPLHYLGVAWYQRDIEIPKSWDGKRVGLFLERPRWETTAWVDDRKIGSNNSLVAPHEYDLDSLTPGKHVLSVRIDNRMILPYRPDGHSVSDALGATWNGIVGRIELSASSPVWIDDAQVFPDVKKKSATVKVQIGNHTGQPGKGTLSCGSKSTPVSWDAAGGTATIEVPLGDAAELWDEFKPQLQNIKLRLEGDGIQDNRKLVFGLREITTESKKILLNGREINLRGTHFGGDFPLTGYPATDVESWKKIIQICKDFGLNHMRFHSWCPPEAAFTAADELGIYLQPECGMWNSFTPGGPIAEMLEKETARMLKAYGNHPSFLLLSPSNEPAGRWPQVLPQWAGRWHERDPRRLYTDKTGWAYQPTTGPQYAIVPVRGNRGWFGRDFAAAVENIPVPVLSHEVGQYCAYPNFDVIEKFTGYLQPGNYEIFRDSAREHGVLEQNRDFAWASGKFQLACYKEEIEANLRTPGMSGFQLLDLHDYLGQGTALIGLLDAFWGSKGYVIVDEFRQFCSPTVPLARFKKYEFRTSEPFEIPVEVAHFGPELLEDATPSWVVTQRGRAGAGATGHLSTRSIPVGKNTSLGTIKVDLSKLDAPAQYTLHVSIPHAERKISTNSWHFWVYPAEIDTSVPAGITITSDWKTAENKLAEGGKVLFTPPESILDDTCPPLNNVPVFWNRLMNPKLESMLGLVVDERHPALAEFPTDIYCDWQWANLVRGARTVNIDKLPGHFRPIVQAIDDWSRNYRLAVIFEDRFGPFGGSGRLLVCTIDITNKLADRPAAAMLRRSLLDYMSGDHFHPQVMLPLDQLRALWPALEGRGVKSAKQSAPPPEIDETPKLPGTPKQ